MSKSNDAWLNPDLVDNPDKLKRLRAVVARDEEVVPFVRQQINIARFTLGATEKAFSAISYAYKIATGNATMIAGVGRAEAEIHPIEREHIDRVHALVAAATTAYTEVSRAYETARSTLESLESTFESHCDEIILHRALLQPVHRMPPAILGQIMEGAADGAARAATNSSTIREARRTPFTLAAVCRRWRDAALLIPEVWRFLLVDLDLVSTPRSSTKAILYMRQMLARSKRTPLYLYIHCSTCDQLAQDLLLEQMLIAATRCETLKIHSSRLGHRLNDFLFARVLFQQFPLLHTFDLQLSSLINDYIPQPDLGEVVFGGRSQIHTLRLDLHEWPAGMLPSMGVTELALTFQSIALWQLHELLEMFHGATVLELTANNVDALAEPTPAVREYSSVRTLRLRLDQLSRDFAERCKFPNATAVALGPAFHSAQPRRARDERLAFMRDHCASVQELTLRAVDADLRLLAALQQHVPLLEKLDIRSSLVSEDFYTALAAVQTRHAVWMCPRLVRLVLVNVTEKLRPHTPDAHPLLVAVYSRIAAHAVSYDMGGPEKMVQVVLAGRNTDAVVQAMLRTVLRDFTTYRLVHQSNAAYHSILSLQPA